MTTYLNLGVVDMPYAHADKTNRGITTGEVADILEDRYHVMEVFFLMHEAEIVDALADSYAGAAESLLLGNPNTPDPATGAYDAIRVMFQNFLDTKQMDALGIGGKYPVPTKASLKGVSHRFKQPYKKRPPRPSFIDTGLYENSFRAWTEQK